MVYECEMTANHSEPLILDLRTKNSIRDQEYPRRALACMVGSLFLVLAFIRWWPLPGPDLPADINYDVRGQEVITMEEITQTRQEAKKPPPPPPIPPVVVPDDVILDDVEFEVADHFLAIEDTGEDVEETDGATVGSNLSFRADSGPRPVRIIEPKYTREARRRNIRAEVVIEVLVDERGGVSEVKVIGRFLLNKDATKREAVASVGYGLEEAAETAALQYIFRPAQEGGIAVRSYTTLTFSFGV